MDVRSYNRDAWDREVASGNRWTVPVDAEAIARARAGQWSVLLTNNMPVPRRWFPADLAGCAILGLASAGGQQGPLLAAAGANVTVLDNSPAQLERDRAVAQELGLALEVVEGDMAELSAFADGQFDLVFHPTSNCFVPDVLPVWREAARVLAPGGALLAGFLNPVTFIFDPVRAEHNELVVRHSIPYSDVTSLTDDERAAVIRNGPLVFGHTLEDQLGGQLAAGLVLVDMYEDRHGGDDAIARILPTMMATRAIKPPLHER
jgi:SAM-dependent methyltransferase